MEFGRLPKSGKFPNISNIDVFKNNQDIDYSLTTPQMTMTMCNVPWDLGEVHVGNRSIGGIGNVVYFKDKAARDRWFDDIPENEKFVWQTMYKDWHNEAQIKVPLPFDQATRFNYIVIDYKPYLTEDNILDYNSTETGWKRWFFFVRECAAASASTTVCKCQRDIWQTIIYDLDIKYMILEEGHAPVAATTPEAFLEDPINNSEYLLDPDIQTQEAKKISSIKAGIINSGPMIAVICASCDISSVPKIDEETAVTPATLYNDQNGVPDNYTSICLDPNDLTAFIEAVTGEYPQYITTVKAFYLVPEQYIAKGARIEWNGITLHYCATSGYRSVYTYEFNAEDFDFPDEYKDLAKLYTSPYSKLVISSENAQLATLDIQECSGTLQLKTAVDGLLTGLKYFGQIDGIGGGTQAVLDYTLLDNRSWDLIGAPYKIPLEWDIPCYSLALSGYDENRISRRFVRDSEKEAAYSAYLNAADNSKIQYQIDCNNAVTKKTTGTLSAEAAKTMSTLTADTGKTTSTLTAETAKTTGDNSANTAYSVAIESASAQKTISNTTAAANKETAERSAAAAKTVSDLNALTSYTNDNSSNDTNYDITIINDQLQYDITEAQAETQDTKSRLDRRLSNTIREYNEIASDNIVIRKNTLSGDITAYTNAVVANTTSLQNEYNLTTTAISNAASLETANNTATTQQATAGISAIGSIVSGAMSGGIVGAIGGAVSGIANGINASLNAETSVENAQVAAEASTNSAIAACNLNSSTAAITQNQNTYMNEQTCTSNTVVTDYQQANLNAVNRETVAEQENIAELVLEVTLENAELMQETADENAETSHDVQEAIIELQYESAVSNAQSTYTAAVSNAATNYSADTSNASTRYSADSANAATIKSNTTANNKLNYDKDISNIKANYDTQTANIKTDNETKLENIDTVYENDMENAKLRLDKEKGIYERDYQTALDQIGYKDKQAALRAPFRYGIEKGGNEENKPKAVVFSIATAAAGAIKQAGDKFLKYGYKYKGYWEFKGFNVMPKYSYWKASEISMEAPGIPDAYVDLVRMYILGGVTVWSEPSYIGTTSIYENY